MRIDLKHIRREKDGRLYVRRNGRSIRLHEPPGTSEFLAEYREALAAIDRPKQTVRKARTDSLAWLFQHYFASPEFRALALGTQRAYRRKLEGITAAHGDKPFAQMEERHVRKLRDEQLGGPEAANTMLKALRSLFGWAVGCKMTSRNVARGVPKVRYRSEGYHTWTPEEVQQYEERWPAGSKQRLALALLLYTGARRGDAVRLGRQMVRDGWLTFRAKKTGAEVTLPILPELQTELDRVAQDQLTFLLTNYGKPFTAAGFGMRFRSWCNEAGLPHCSAHGLRKAGATMAAENGATEMQLNAVFGWADSSREAARYTRTARRKKLVGTGAKLISVPRNRSGTEIDEKQKIINGEN